MSTIVVVIAIIIAACVAVAVVIAIDSCIANVHGTNVVTISSSTAARVSVHAPAQMFMRLALAPAQVPALARVWIFNLSIASIVGNGASTRVDR